MRTHGKACAVRIICGGQGILVPDDNVHLSHSPPSFGTQGTLILDIIIAFYYTTLFFIIFSNLLYR